MATPAETPPAPGQEISSLSMFSENRMRRTQFLESSAPLRFWISTRMK